MEIDSGDCSNLRREYRAGIIVDQLAAEYDVTETTVRYHLRGECIHESEAAPVELETTDVPPSECEAMREAFANGESPHDIADTEDRYWQAVRNHLTGECDHEGGPIFASEEVLEWQPIPVERCEEMRRQVREGEAITEIAADSTWAYPSVLSHINGECGHANATVAPREKDDRAGNFGESACRELRSTHATADDVAIEDLISEYDISEKTAMRHIRYECTHRAQGEIRERIEDAGLDAWMDGRKASSEEESVKPPSTSNRPREASSDDTDSSSTDRVDDVDNAGGTSTTPPHDGADLSTEEESTATAANGSETPSSRTTSPTSTSELDSSTASDPEEASKPASANGQASTDAGDNETVGSSEETNTETDTATSTNSPTPSTEERGEEGEKETGPTWTVSLGVKELAALRAIDPDTDIDEQALKATTTSTQDSLDGETPPVQDVGETVERTLYPTDRLAGFVNTLVESDSTPYATSEEFINAAIVERVSEYAPETEITIDGVTAVALSAQGEESDQRHYAIEAIEDRLQEDLQ